MSKACKVQVRMRPDERAYYREMAEVRGLNLSKMIRVALDRFIKQSPPVPRAVTLGTKANADADADADADNQWETW